MRLKTNLRKMTEIIHTPSENSTPQLNNDNKVNSENLTSQVCSEIQEAQLAKVNSEDLESSSDIGNNGGKLRYWDTFKSLTLSLWMLMVSIVIVGIVSYKGLKLLGSSEFMSSTLSSQLSMLFFALYTYRFKWQDIWAEFDGKLKLDIITEGLKLTILTLSFNIILGFLIDTGGEVSETVEGFARESSLNYSLLMAVLVAPIVEELGFRGGLKRVLQRGELNNNWIYVLISSLLFGSLHYGPGNLGVTHMALTSFMGVIYSISYLRTNNIYINIFGHMSYNAIVLLVANINHLS